MKVRMVTVRRMHDKLKSISELMTPVLVRLQSWSEMEMYSRVHCFVRLKCGERAGEQVNGFEVNRNIAKD